MVWFNHTKYSSIIPHQHSYVKWKVGEIGSQESVSNKGYSRLKRILLFCLVYSFPYFESAVLSNQIWCTEPRLNCYSRIPQIPRQAQFKCSLPFLTTKTDILMLTSGYNPKSILDFYLLITHSLWSREWTSHITDCAGSSEKHPSCRAASMTPPSRLSGSWWTKHLHWVVFLSISTGVNACL